MSGSLNPMAMRKLLLLIFGALVALPAISQTKLAEVVRLWKPYYVVPTDGLVVKQIIHDKMDSALFSKTGIDTFEMTITYRKISGSKPPPILPDIISTVDDNVATPALLYNPSENAGDNIFITAGWSHMKGQTWNVNHFNNTASFIDGVATAFVEVSCSPCYKIEWYTEKRVNHGIASVQIDGGAAVDVDLYDPRTDNNSLLVFTTPALPNAAHKLRVSYTGRKNAAATQTNLLHDYFKTYTKQ